MTGVFNPPEKLAPVDCPLLLLMPEGKVLAQRTKYVTDKSDQYEYELLELEGGVYKGTGKLFTGRYPWTYP